MKKINYQKMKKTLESNFTTKLDQVLNDKKDFLNNLKNKKDKLINNWDNKKDKLINDFKQVRITTNLFKSLQNSIEKKVNIQSEDAFLRQSNFWAKGITWSFIGGSTLGIIWLSLAKTEEIVIAQGKLEPIKKVIDIQMPFNGIASEILVKEGELVSKGQILIKLDNRQTENMLLKTNKLLSINKDILKKYENLFKEGAVSELQYLQQVSSVTELESEIKNLELTNDLQNIKSPTNGIVFDLLPKSEGFVGRPSEPILKIVPNDNLRARIEIQNRSIGFVNIGKSVDISIDSYPAGDFGVIQGELTSIGSDALPPDRQQGKGYRFPAEIKLNNQYLLLKNGKKLPLQTGMSLTANIKLRKVSYLQLLLNTFQEKADSLRTL